MLYVRVDYLAFNCRDANQGSDYGEVTVRQSVFWHIYALQFVYRRGPTKLVSARTLEMRTDLRSGRLAPRHTGVYSPAADSFHPESVKSYVGALRYYLDVRVAQVLHSVACRLYLPRQSHVRVGPVRMPTLDP